MTSNQDVCSRSLVSTREFAEFLKISVRTLRRMISAGEVPKPTRVGRQLRWRSEDVNAWYAAKYESK
ncbi:helix-turn-helix transcriptional regulator [Rubinisphaera brasiliensis]|uniref:DNA binding domain protein, excisionase family n=1 Tax=Rubinisphaera brasiliensis (strain ATCC 49424 / DSM 5305 / JCM 21570 / IAM 15109 / NBRC 103401 / IFAM 1448) TaxID=756272 RepID=F0SKK9_RUBBR|nr:DNA binding domain protein, excisionase family [Rubinisphaera brasiliensis DSM 5305]